MLKVEFIRKATMRTDGGEYEFLPGQEVELDDDAAERLDERGIAKIVGRKGRPPKRDKPARAQHGSGVGEREGESIKPFYRRTGLKAKV